MKATKGRLGDRLIERGLISQAQLEVALSEQRRAYRPLGEILISLGFVGEEHVARLLAEDLGLEFKQAHEVEPDPLVVASIDAEFVRAAGCFPLRMENGSLVVMMSDPDNPEKSAAVRARFPYPLAILVTTDAEIHRLLRVHMPKRDGQLAQLFADFDGSRVSVQREFPVERATQALLLDGLHRGATDIHLEPEEKVTRVRYRLDGILLQGENLPREVTDAVISRIKVLANLDIAERRRPQDGRLRLSEDGRSVDLRVSVMPVADGENVVCRILDRGGVALKLGELGVREDQQKLLSKIGERSHGLFLVTGPTGSGKTTTLYALLSTIDAMHRNVATIEDPIEYRMPLLRQSQVDPAIGFGFKEGLRALLRQDPDVILVGEIRDQETADMAIKASMTGHLVFSTLHTNSSIGAIPRLVDLGIEPYLIEDALIGVFAQRLVRRNCSFCARPVELSKSELEFLEGEPGEAKRGAGCSRCNETGFAGRAAICELFLPNDEMAELLRRGADLLALRRLADEAGFKTMADDGRAKVRAGVTTVAEILRVNRSHRFSRSERADV
ncbi:MAG: type II/IV secretion system protein [Planctomycetes bacterium]|nr:type II/IV secretion system protein [Planctomycetota bacterium]